MDNKLSVRFDVFRKQVENELETVSKARDDTKKRLLSVVAQNSIYKYENDKLCTLSEELSECKKKLKTIPSDVLENLESPVILGTCCCLNSLLETDCGLYRMSCSHYMHLDCLTDYINVYANDINYAMKHGERLPLKKLSCPMCKTGSLFDEVKMLPYELSISLQKVYKTVETCLVKSIRNNSLYTIGPAIELHE